MAWYSVCWGPLSVCKNLVLLTSGTPLDVVCDPFFHSRPPVFFLCSPEGFVSTWVSSCWMIVHKGHDASFNFEDQEHNDSSFGVHDSGCCYEFFFREYYNILVISFSLVSTGRSGECVWGCVGFARYVEDFVVVFLEVRMPSCCSSIEVLWGFLVL